MTINEVITRINETINQNGVGSITARKLKEILLGLAENIRSASGVGSQGPRGERGFTGNPGATGAQGRQGRAGESGADGRNGEDGLQGPAGIEGERGYQGRVGAEGRQGMVGLQGPMGSGGSGDGQGGKQGPKGSQGPKGLEGTNGVNGSQGIQGPAGSGGSGGSGSQGPIGNQGPAGPAGSGSGGQTPQFRIKRDTDTNITHLQVSYDNYNWTNVGILPTFTNNDGDLDIYYPEVDEGPSSEQEEGSGLQGPQGPNGGHGDDSTPIPENIDDRISNLEDRIEEMENYAELTVVIGFQGTIKGRTSERNDYGYYSSEVDRTFYEFSTSYNAGPVAILGPSFYYGEPSPVVIAGGNRAAVNKREDGKYVAKVRVKKGDGIRLIVMCNGYQSQDSTVSVYSDETRSVTLSWATEGKARFQVMPSNQDADVVIIDTVANTNISVSHNSDHLFMFGTGDNDMRQQTGRHNEIIIASNENGGFGEARYTVWNPDYEREIGRLYYLKDDSYYEANSTSRIPTRSVTSAKLYSDIIVPIDMSLEGTYDTYSVTIGTIPGGNSAVVMYNRQWHEKKGEFKVCNAGDVLNMYTYGEKLTITYDRPYTIDGPNYVKSSWSYIITSSTTININPTQIDIYPYYLYPAKDGNGNNISGSFRYEELHYSYVYHDPTSQGFYTTLYDAKDNDEIVANTNEPQFYYSSSIHGPVAGDPLCVVVSKEGYEPWFYSGTLGPGINLNPVLQQYGSDGFLKVHVFSEGVKSVSTDSEGYVVTMVGKHTLRITNEEQDPDTGEWTVETEESTSYYPQGGFYFSVFSDTDVTVRHIPWDGRSSNLMRDGDTSPYRRENLNKKWDGFYGSVYRQVICEVRQGVGEDGFVGTTEISDENGHLVKIKVFAEYYNFE